MCGGELEGELSLSVGMAECEVTVDHDVHADEEVSAMEVAAKDGETAEFYTAWNSDVDTV
jgi:hypothetical protein